MFPLRTISKMFSIASFFVHGALPRIVIVTYFYNRFLAAQGSCWAPSFTSVAWIIGGAVENTPNTAELPLHRQYQMLGACAAGEGGCHRRISAGATRRLENIAAGFRCFFFFSPAKGRPRLSSFFNAGLAGRAAIIYHRYLRCRRYFYIRSNC